MLLWTPSAGSSAAAQYFGYPMLVWCSRRADSPYFDCDYFDQTYFDTGDCPPTGGHHAVRILRRPEYEFAEDDELFALI